MWVFKLAFPWIVLSAACIGALAGRKMPERFQTHSLHALNSSDQPPAIIDDNTPPPAHARFNRGKLVQILLSGAILWSGAMAILWKIYGWEGALTQMAWFFTKAALLTFGGAYAVLPYVYQGAVEQFHWLTAAQMMDGLALGETTPGPLVMVISFAGFIAGWGQAILGEEHLFLSGALTACVVTYFTFLPSFLFILAGGPLVESSHGNVKWNAPLTSISAAVVGVIVNLAVFFGKQVFWPQGWESSADVVAIAMSSIAFFALTRLKLGIISVIVMAATMGALFKHEWFFTGLSFY
jgi:chromate transporter